MEYNQSIDRGLDEINSLVGQISTTITDIELALEGLKPNVKRLDTGKYLSKGKLCDFVRALAFEPFSYAKGWDSHPIVIGKQTVYCILQPDLHTKLIHAKDVQLEIASNGKDEICLCYMRDGMGTIKSIISTDSFYESIRLLTEQRHIEAQPNHIYCMQNRFITYKFDDVLHHGRKGEMDVSVFQAGSSKAIGTVALNNEFVEVVKSHTIDEPVSVSLYPVMNKHGAGQEPEVYALIASYDQISGSSYVCYLSAESVKRGMANNSNQAEVTVIDELRMLNVVSDTRVQLPSQRLTHYETIKQKVLKAGGTYRQQGFDFIDREASEVIEALIDGKNVVTRKKELSFFPTPPQLARQVVAKLDITANSRILEPHAGAGAIADEVRSMGCEPVVNELWGVNLALLIDKGYKPHWGDFLQVTPEMLGGKFDGICGNPPWGNLTDIDHFLHALTFLKPGGQLSFLMSRSCIDNFTKKTDSFRKVLNIHNAKISLIEPRQFEGTNVGGYHIFIDNYAA